MIKSVLLFVLAGLCEIGGGYLVWLWLRNGKSALLGALAAEWLMTSQPKLSVPVGSPLTAVREVTDLSKSAFLASRDGRVIAVRQSISAVLLMAIWEHELHVVGMLHPEPAVVFD